MVKLTLNVVMAERNMSSQELAKAIGITPANLSILKTGKAKAGAFADDGRMNPTH